MENEGKYILVYFSHYSSPEVVSYMLLMTLGCGCLEIEWLETEWLGWRSVTNQYKNIA